MAENPIKAAFARKFREYVETFNNHVAAADGQWTIKGFIDIYKNVYTISCDTKIVSKILEIHLFPQLLKFAEDNGYRIVLADHQNYYPDITFVHATDNKIKFAVDFKTTYRKPDMPGYCNGFTLGSHGKYFTDRTSRKNIQFPYNDYSGHFCLGIIYTRSASTDIDETAAFNLDKLQSIPSVIKDFQFFFVEKWQIASDKSGSGNTANIGSITKIPEIIEGKGMFCQLGEPWFDDYWMNYGKITIRNAAGETKKISNLHDFVTYRSGDVAKITRRTNSTRKKGVL